MPEFDIEQFKKTWQEQAIQPKYNSDEIRLMLNKSSRNYVKYILGISIAEFLVILGMNFYYIFLGDDTNSYLNILEKLGVKNNADLIADLSHLYFVLKVISLILTGFFVFKFYKNYKHIKIESNLTKLILQIIKFKNTVNYFILANVFLIILYTIALGIFASWALSNQNITLTHPTLVGFYVGLLLMMILSVVLIWVYYRIVYGIILKKLGKNLEELQKIELGQS